jgi:VanZ family protein
VSAWLWRWGPAAVQMAAIFGISSVQNLQALPADISDKTGHFVGYAMLGAFVFRALANVRWEGYTGRTAWGAWLVSTLYGATDELHQRVVPGRTAALDDWIADAIGAAVAVLIVLVVATEVRRRR